MDDQLKALLITHTPENEVNEVVNRIKVLILRTLPPAVDIDQKYELGPQEDLFVTTKGKASDSLQITYVATYAEDRGWNKYRGEVERALKPRPTMIK
jgi:hypothetical protein